MHCLGKFLSDETGAVTVDWVVLTAAVVTMAMLIFPYLSSPVSNMAAFIAVQVDGAEAFMD